MDPITADPVYVPPSVSFSVAAVAVPVGILVPSDPVNPSERIPPFNVEPSNNIALNTIETPPVSFSDIDVPPPFIGDGKVKRIPVCTADFWDNTYDLTTYEASALRG